MCRGGSFGRFSCWWQHDRNLYTMRDVRSLYGMLNDALLVLAISVLAVTLLVILAALVDTCTVAPCSWDVRTLLGVGQ